MPVLLAISSKNRWAIRSGRPWSELIGVPTASTDAVQSCRLGPISAVVGLLAAGVSARHQGSNIAFYGNHGQGDGHRHNGLLAHNT